jgi:hypothetical protein
MVGGGRGGGASGEEESRWACSSWSETTTSVVGARVGVGGGGERRGDERGLRSGGLGHHGFTSPHSCVVWLIVAMMQRGAQEGR